MHVDGNNHGPTRMKALGDFSGGQLCIKNAHGEKELTARETIRGFPELNVGDVIRGRVECMKHRCEGLNGHRPASDTRKRE